MNVELRAHRGASYGVHTKYRTRKNSGDFLIFGDIRAEELIEALRLVRETLQRFGRQPCSPSEIEAGKTGLLADIATDLSTNADIARSLAQLHMTGLPPDFHRTLADRIHRLLLRTFKLRLGATWTPSAWLSPSSPPWETWAGGSPSSAASNGSVWRKTTETSSHPTRDIVGGQEDPCATG